MAQDFERAKDRRADDLADRSPAEIRADMARTRSALDDKLGALEDKVANKVQFAKDKVEEVRDKAKDVAQKVKRSFDLPYQVRQHPWPALGASVLVGVVLGSFGGDSDSETKAPRLDHGENGFGGSSSLRGSEVAPRRPGMFAEELRYLRETAIGAMMSLVRNGLKQTFPGLAPQTARVVDGITRKLGGEPIGDVFRGPAD